MRDPYCNAGRLFPAFACQALERRPIAHSNCPMCCAKNQVRFVYG
jgi:hypothetical protein